MRRGESEQHRERHEAAEVDGNGPDICRPTPHRCRGVFAAHSRRSVNVRVSSRASISVHTCECTWALTVVPRALYKEGPSRKHRYMPRSSSRIALRAAALRRIWMPLLVGAIFIPSAQSLAQEANSVTDIIPFPTNAKTLGNGLEVIGMPMPSSGLVAFWSIVRTGSRDEYEPGRSGFAHFFEHMMFRGTERYPPARYLEVTTRIGADANAYTTDDHTAYHLSLSKEDFESVLEIESDRFQNLAYSEAAFQAEAGAVYGEYRKSRTDPEFALEEQLMATAFEKHTYGHTTMGFERDIAAMPKMYDYSRSFFARYYRPENTVLFVSGDVTPEGVLALVEKYYGGW